MDSEVDASEGVSVVRGAKEDGSDAGEARSVGVGIAGDKTDAKKRVGMRQRGFKAKIDSQQRRSQNFSKEATFSATVQRILDWSARKAFWAKNLR